MKALLLLLLTAGAAFGQLAKDKPAPPRPPAEALVGVWFARQTYFDEYMTFTADGRLILQRGQNQETKTGTYKTDAATPPWKLDMTLPVEGQQVTVYNIWDFPAPDQFRMARPSAEEKSRPGAEALKDSKLVMQRLSLGAHGGIFQVVQVHLKGLTGTWEGKQGKVSAAISFTADGKYTIKTDEFTDQGSFRIDVSKVPCALDLLSSEGLGPKYGIYEITAEGKLKLGHGPMKVEERPKNFDSPGTMEFIRRDAAKK
jgi:hypothetical protein